MEINKELLEKCYVEFKSKLSIYNKMYEYYKGNTDIKASIGNHTKADGITNVNYLKKFIKEEISYSIANNITFSSRSGNVDYVNIINDGLYNLSDNHSISLMKYMLIFGKAYEIYYIDSNLEFNSRLVKANEGYIYKDEYNETQFFMHVFKKRFDEENTYIDLYTKDGIQHLDEEFNEILSIDQHYFGIVPVGVARISEEEDEDTLFKDIRSLQDSFEQILTDAINEQADTRSAYMVVHNMEVTKETAERMKELGMIQIPNKDGNVSWLIKSLDSAFILGMLELIQDLMYQVSFHINHNEKMQSNSSGVALRSRLISLEEKTKLNQRALNDCLKTRLKCLAIYLLKAENINLDIKDIVIKYTANVPQDDLATAQMIAQLGDKISVETAVEQLSFVSNASAEKEKIKKERKELLNETVNLDGVNLNATE